MLPYKTGTVRVTSPYGRRFIFGYWEMHRGIDLVGDAKDKTVRAVADGTSELNGSYGWLKWSIVYGE